jgi:hypothetical protein
MQQAHLGKSIKNDMWITEDEDERTPDVLPELPGFHVLVRPVSIKKKLRVVYYYQIQLKTICRI